MLIIESDNASDYYQSLRVIQQHSKQVQRHDAAKRLILGGSGSLGARDPTQGFASTRVADQPPTSLDSPYFAGKAFSLLPLT